MENGVKMARRIESPSSINTYNQCPRKYYYTYIAKIPTKGNLYTIKGNVVHEVLESFFSHTIAGDTDYSNSEQRFKSAVFSLFASSWRDKKDKIGKIEVSEGEAAIGIDDCVNMLYLWVELFIKKMKATGLPFKEAFESLKPKHTEKYFSSKEHSVQGYVDVIEEKNGKIRLMDYKTSFSSYITDEYLLQLGIYALLFTESVNSIPHEVGIYFLKDKDGEKVLNVTESLLENAKKQIKAHHIKTISGDIKDYPKIISGRCKWAGGRCDFYDLCFNKDGTERKDEAVVENGGINKPI